MGACDSKNPPPPANNAGNCPQGSTAPCPDKEFKELTDGIIIEGDDAFKQKVKEDLRKIYDTPSGKKLLQNIKDSGKKLTIKKSAGGNGENADNFTNGLRKQNGDKGPGTDATVNFNPDKTTIGDGSEDWMKRPTSVGLAHELIHAAHDMNGTTEYDYSDKTKKPQNYEPQTVGLKATKDGKEVDYSGNDFTENKIRKEMGEPERPRY